MFCKSSLSTLLCGEVKSLLKSHCKLPGLIATLPIIRSKWNDMNVFENKPKPGHGYYRRTVHYPEKYTIKPIPTTNLGGRCPIRKRVVVKTLGGGLKHPYLWVDYMRQNPLGQPPLVERVLEVMPEPNRSAHVALVGHGDKLRYIIATENMKPGDKISTSSELTRIAVKAKEGDAFPLGSLPAGTVVCCVEFRPGKGAFYARAAGTQCTIVRKLENRVICMMPHKRELAFDPNCMAVVGRVSNAIHNTIPIGSANRLRWLGYRPRSGLYQKKTGRFGRKIHPPKACLDVASDPLPREKILLLTLQDFPYHLPGVK